MKSWIWGVGIMLLALAARAEVWEFQAPPSDLTRQTVNADWRQYERLVVSVTLDERSSATPLICSVFLETKDNQWYESRSPVKLEPGVPHVFSLSLAERSADWEGHGVLRPWGRDVLRWVRDWGVKVFAGSEVSGKLHYEASWQRYAKPPMPTVARVTLPASVTAGELATVQVEIDNLAVNPYRASMASFWLEIGTGEERPRERFAYVQAYEQATPPYEEPRWTPLDRPAWRAVWRPETPGSYPLRLVGQVEGVPLLQEMGTLNVTTSADQPAPDQQQPDLAPTKTDFLLATEATSWLRASSAGWTPAVQLDGAVWQVPLDWTTGWGRYTGLGEFEQQVAWQFEQQAKTAAPHPILLFNQSELEGQATYRWAQHPLNVANGGHLTKPESLFTDSRAHELILDRARYLWARYGSLPGVNGLAVVLNRPGNLPRAWLEQLAQDLARELPAAPLFTTNSYLRPRAWTRALKLAGEWRLDPRLAAGTTLAAGDRGWTTLRGELPLAVVAPLSHESWVTTKTIMVDIASADQAADQLRVQCFLRTWRDVVYESTLHPLPGPGRFRLAFSLAEDQWRKPLHPSLLLTPYDRLHVQEIGIRIFAGSKMTTQVELGPGVELWGPVAGDEPEPMISAIRVSGKALANQPLALSFDALPLTDEPFETSQANLTLRIKGPGETVITRPVWLHLPLKPLGAGEATPDGQPEWRATFTPPLPGDYRLTVTGAIAGQALKRGMSLKVAAGEPPAGAPATALQAQSQRLFLYRPSGWIAPPPTVARAWWNVPLRTASVDGAYHGPRPYGLSRAANHDAETDLAAQGAGLLAEDRQAPLLVFSDEELRLASTFTWPHQDAGFYDSEQQVALVVMRARYLWARYGGYAGIDGMVIDQPLPGEHESDWVQKVATALHQAVPGVPIYSNCPALPARSWQRPVPVTWRTDDRLSTNTRLETTANGSQIAGRYPGSTAVTAKVNEHWVGAATLALDVDVPAEARHNMKALVFVRTDRTRLWEHELLPLRGGSTNRLYVRLDDPAAWHRPDQPKARIHAYEFLQVKEIGIRFFHDQAATIALDVGPPMLLGPLKIDEATQPQLAIEGIVALTPHPAQFSRYELAFHLNRTFTNPYDPEQVDVEIEWTDPAGDQHRHPGFFLQPIELREEDQAERLTWGGEPEWHTRFTPQQPGEYRWRLIVKSQHGTATQEGSFTCEARQAHGFVRLSPADPRSLEFGDGSYFYPIGHNLRSPSDRRKQLSDKVWDNVLTAESEGIYAFRRWFRSMAQHGENYTRMWLCPWWAGLEWNADTPGYHGLGYYNQENAARVDRVLEFAEQSGIYLNLEPMNHGQLSTRIDNQWTLNPLCEAQPGGFLRYATDFFSSKEAQRLHRQRMRYVIARWGYSPAIAFWGIITETEWIEAYDRSLGHARDHEGPYIPAPYASKRYKQSVATWLDDVGAFFRQTDAHPHLVSTHFSNPTNGTEVWDSKNLQLMHNNAYTLFSQIGWDNDAFAASNGVADVIYVFGRSYERIAKKPILIGEWGGTPYGDPVEPLRQELHTGLWAMAMTNCVGVTGWWWWNVLDAYNDYDQFQAIARFTAGEDRRGRNLQSYRISLLKPDGTQSVPSGYQLPAEWQIKRGDVIYDPKKDADHRFALILYDNQGLWAYTYERDINRYKISRRAKSFDDPSFPLAEGYSLPLPEEFPNGYYRVTFWNTWTGTVFQQVDLTIDAEHRVLPLPPHRADLALKLQPSKAN